MLKNMKEKIVVLDFGGQYNQLIARRIRDLHVYSEILPYQTPLTALEDPSIKGIIFTGGPNSVYHETSPHIDAKIFSLGKPILGICYGAQLIAYTLGGKVEPIADREYGARQVEVDASSLLFHGLEKQQQVFMSHGDQVTALPAGFRCTSSSTTCPNAAFEDEKRGLYAVQFHPEVEHSLKGQEMLANFAYSICHCSPSWKPDDFLATKIEEIREQVGDHKVLCALSGGVDSAVVAALVSRAIGKRLTCVFVDHGLLRKDEAKQVVETFSPMDLNFIKVDAADTFFAALKGVEEPEQKRKIIGRCFIETFEKEEQKLNSNDYFLAQGTIYPDRIESGLGLSAKIKSHHNVGGLPKDIEFLGLVEPLKDLFKDEVRAVGKLLGLPDAIVHRQPFPGPGLGIRVVGEVTPEKVHIVQEADAIFRQELEQNGIRPSQYFAALSNMRSVGVQGDSRSYDYAVVLRAVQTDDFMTAEPYEIPFSLLKHISERIINEVKGVNRVLYDSTSKPPSTIELE